MTVNEAERASDEMVNTAKPEDDVEHFRQLNEAIEDGNVEKLADVIEEGTDDKTRV